MLGFRMGRFGGIGGAGGVSGGGSGDPYWAQVHTFLDFNSHADGYAGEVLNQGYGDDWGTHNSCQVTTTDPIEGAASGSTTTNSMFFYDNSLKVPLTYGADDFFIELSLRRTTNASTYGRIYQTSNADIISGISWTVNSPVSADTLLCHMTATSQGSPIVDLPNVLTMSPIGQIDHLAMGRSGDTVYWFKNGVLQTTAAFAGTMIAPVTHVIGSQSSLRSQPGIWDKVRITVGTCRHTSNYTVDTNPFPTT